MDNSQKTVEVIIKGQQANATLREMQATARILNAELRKLPVNSQEFADKTKELQQVNKRLKSITDDVKGIGGIFGKIGQEVKAFGIVAMGALGFQWLSSKVQDLIGQNAKLSDSFADICKTTGMTESEVQKLNKAFSQMDTRTATKDLRDIAISAGQLGIAKKDILAFTAATDKLVVALGDEFTGGAEEVSNTMGKLRNVFLDIKSDNISDDMLHIGNAVNELGASGMATSPVISDFANRIGGVGINLGLTSGQVLGLSATLQELNVSTERGGTAVTKILLKMANETDKFAKVAGMSTANFAELVNKDLYGAFVKVAEGSKKGGTSATAFSKILDELGVDGAGASEVFSKLGGNTEMLQKKVDLANISLKGTDSIMNEFAIKNETFAADLDKIGKSLSSAFVSGPIMKGMQSMVGWFADLVTNTHASSDAMVLEQTELESTKIKILSLNVGNSERTKLLKELKDQYPDYLGNLNAETASNNAVRKSIDGVINSLVDKIIIQRKSEELAEQAEKTADKREKQYEAERNLLAALAKVHKENALARQRSGDANVKLMSKELEGLPDMVAAQAFLDERNTGLSRMNDNVVGLATALDKMKAAEIAYNAQLLKGNDIQKEKDELMKRLGISTGAGTGDSAADKKAAAEAAAYKVEMNQGAADKIKAAHEKLIADIAALELDAYHRELGEDALELAKVDEKYAKLLIQAKGFKEEEDRINWMYALEYADVLQKQEEKALANKILADAKKLEGTKKSKKEEDDFLANKTKNKKDNEDKETADAVEKQKEKAKKILAIVREFEQQVVSIIDSVNTINKNKDSAELSQLNATLKAKQDKNHKALASEKISQKKHDAEAIKMQKQHDAAEAEIKKRGFERDQKISKFKAVLNLAEGITKIWATYGFNPVLAGILTAVEVAMVGVQMAAIESAPKPYAKGGYTVSDNPQGFTNGPTLYTNSASGSNFIAGEAGKEFIVPNWMVQNPKIAPILDHLDTIRVNRGFAAGGSTATQTTAPVFTQNNTPSANNTELVAAINRLNGHLDNGIAAHLGWDSLTRDMGKIDAAKNAARG